MYNIDAEILEKYGMSTWDEFYNSWKDELTEAQTKELYCHTFLQQTDHIPNKIIEATALGNEPEDYTEILNYRQLARNEINKIMGSL